MFKTLTWGFLKLKHQNHFCLKLNFMGPCSHGWTSRAGWSQPSFGGLWGWQRWVAPPAEGTGAGGPSHAGPVEREATFQEGVMRPMRVHSALKNSKTFEEFRRNRPFKFLHLYSGPNDPLGEAIKVEAARNRLEVVVLSLDNKLDPTLDLSRPASHQTMMQDVGRGEWDYIHSGFPCGSFSMARRHQVVGQPGPVRDKTHIYGLPTNDERQQSEADRGTRMAVQSAEVYEKQVKACEARKVPPLATLENPPGSEEPGSAWDLPELQQKLEVTGGSKVHYNTCAYMIKDKARFKKPGVWAGRLENIRKLSKVCMCPNWVTHVALVGKQLTASAAQYPAALAEAVAVEVVGVWKKTLNLEWWRFKLETKSQEVSDLQKAWLENEDKKSRGETERTPASKRAASMAFKIDNIESDDLPSGSKGTPSKKIKENHNMLAVGGMRNPARSVRRLTQLGDVGRKIARLWDEFMESHPTSIRVAANYGKPDNAFDQELVQLWRDTLKDHLAEIVEKPVVVKENWEFTSPLDAELWQAWGAEAGDPDLCLPDFIRRGSSGDGSADTSERSVPPCIGSGGREHGTQRGSLRPSSSSATTNRWETKPRRQQSRLTVTSTMGSQRGWAGTGWNRPSAPLAPCPKWPSFWRRRRTGRSRGESSWIWEGVLVTPGQRSMKGSSYLDCRMWWQCSKTSGRGEVGRRPNAGTRTPMTLSSTSLTSPFWSAEERVATLRRTGWARSRCLGLVCNVVRISRGTAPHGRIVISFGQTVTVVGVPRDYAVAGVCGRHTGGCVGR